MTTALTDNGHWSPWHPKTLPCPRARSSKSICGRPTISRQDESLQAFTDTLHVGKFYFLGYKPTPNANSIIVSFSARPWKSSVNTRWEVWKQSSRFATTAFGLWCFVLFQRGECLSIIDLLQTLCTLHPRIYHYLDPMPFSFMAVLGFIGPSLTFCDVL
ncbi:hypothetical protein BDN67DRAFT_968107 [Paxillus ammoniavirescens]|nr:hypothetical protein BDN67DRAFT_968107 [Paxillus ammoniavirescens]